MPANVDTMFYYGEKPWHGLGTELEHAATSEEAIRFAELDWEVKLLPLVAQDKRGQNASYIQIPEQFAVIRVDKKRPLGIVGRLYTPIQNKDAFNFFDLIVGEKKAMYHVAGALGQGEVIWILAKLPDDIRITGTNDIINKYLLLTNSHNGMMSLRMFFTPIRVVCQNTLSAAMSVRKAGEGIALRHFPDIQKKVEQARKVLGISIDFYKELSEAFNQLARVQITPVWLAEYVDAVMPSQDETISARLKHIRDNIMERFESPSNSLPGVKGTAWAAYNAVTEYVDHLRPIPKIEADRTRRLQSVWLGSGAQLKDRALTLALDKIGTRKIAQPVTVV